MIAQEVHGRAAHAFSVLDAYVFGFVLTEVNLPFQADDAAEDFVDSLGPLGERFPHLALPGPDLRG